MKFSIQQESRPGKRATNEDRLGHAYSREALLLVIADGMGGHHYGEIAAQIAVQTFTEAFRRHAQPQVEDPFLLLEKGLENAHRAIRDYSALHRLDDSPRTTCVACLVQNNVAYWAHVGDSRLYLIRGGRTIFHTRDHSRVRLLVDQGSITEAQAARHPDRNKIYSCLGGPETPEIEFSRKTPLLAGDVLALCTDGVWGVLPEDILAVALSEPDMATGVPKLLDQAEKLGGAHADNLSIVVVRWEDSYVERTESTAPASPARPAYEEGITTHFDEFGRGRSHRSNLPEAEIESAIAEIRAAIQKYSR